MSFGRNIGVVIVQRCLAAATVAVSERRVIEAVVDEAIAKCATTGLAGTDGVTHVRLSNGEVEGPGTHADQATRAHTVFPRPRRQTDHPSRPPPTIVRRHDLTPTVPALSDELRPELDRPGSA